MKLARNEHILGDWTYSMAKSGKLWKKKKTTSSLILTNRRLMHSINAKRSSRRTDINLNDIVSIDYQHSRLFNFWAVLQFIIGIPLCVVIVGIFMIRNALRKMNRGDFLLNVTTAGNSCLSVGSRNLDPSKEGLLVQLIKLPFKLIGKLLGIDSANANMVKIHIDHKVVNEIVDCLGAAVLDCQNH